MLYLLRLFLFLLLLAAPRAGAAYSVLTHRALIDSAWEATLTPLLQRRYPGTSPEQLLEAKSYAYGGAIIQDLGYYPLGTTLFTNLTHYVRPGDFVRNLLAGARGRNEYAFALGALSHYAADATGHPAGTNRIMPAVYPDLRAEFGEVVTYENAPKRHTELEFSFDVVQVAAGHYRTQDYHKYVGFRVSKPVLERAFRQTYGLELGQLLLNVDLTVGTFRFTVNQLIPAAARAAWHNQRAEIRRVSPRARRRDYLYRASPRRFEQEYGRDYERPGLGARILSLGLKLLPKIGPLKTYAFRLPDAAGEALFRSSYRAALARFGTLVEQQPTDSTALPPPLPDANLDTGAPAHAPDYHLTAATYAQLLRELHHDKFAKLTPALRQDLLSFFTQAPPPPPLAEADKEDRRAQQQTQEALAALRGQQP